MRKYTLLVFSQVQFVMYCVGKVQSVITLMQVVCIVTTVFNELRE